MVRAILALLVFIPAALFAAACSSGGGLSASERSEQTSKIGSVEDLETVRVPTRWASTLANDLSTLTANSDAIFVGRVLRLREQREEQLVPGAPAESSPVDGKPARVAPTFPVSTFEVLVERAVRAGEETEAAVVLIEQAGGVVKRADGSMMRLVLDGDEPLVTGERYLFFALQKENGTLSAAPFARMTVRGERVEATPPWAGLGAMQALSGRNVDEALVLVRAAEAGRP